MSKKKVLILIGIPNFDYSNDKSAVLSWMKQIKKAFEENGDEAFFANYNQEKNDDYIVENRKSTLHKLKILFKKWPWLYYSVVYRKYFKSQTLLLKRLQKEVKFDLIVEFHTVGSIIGVEIAKQWDVPLSVIFDSPVDEQFREMHGTKTMYWRHICKSEKVSMEYANKIMVYSTACREFLELKYKVQGEINELPCILNKEQNKISKKKTSTFNIGFIGSFLKWHKVDMLVTVFEKFHNSYPDSRLILLGFGQEWSAIKKKVEGSVIESHCEIPGFVSESELTRFKSEFTIGVMPGSNWYGSPLKLFEYAESGIPFIAPPSKTVHSIFKENEHCLYVKLEDEEGSLLKAFEAFYLSPELRKRLGRNGQEMIEGKFNKEAYYKELINNLH